MCKVCGERILRLGEMEWSTCNVCAAKCEHQYKNMVGQVNGNLAQLPCCTKCGRGDPDWVPNADPMVDMLNTVAAGGLKALVLEHPDGSSTTVTKK